MSTYRVLVDIYKGEDKDGEDIVQPYGVTVEAGSEGEAMLKGSDAATARFGFDNNWGAWSARLVEDAK